MEIKLQLFGGRGVASFRTRKVRGYSTKVHSGRQGKHIPGHNNYMEGRSIVTIDQIRLQNLINKYAGKGVKRGENKELINFGEIIGRYYNKSTAQYEYTSWGIIHYSKDGVHLVPANPKQH